MTEPKDKKIEDGEGADKAPRSRPFKKYGKGRGSHKLKGEAARYRAFQEPERMKVFLDAFRLGASIRLACQVIGVGDSTFYQLKQETEIEQHEYERGRGKKPAKWRTDLLDAIEKAVGEGYMHALGRIRYHMTQDDARGFHAAAWMLERKLPQEFGRPWRQDGGTTAKDGDESKSGVLIAPGTLTPEQWISAQAQANAATKEPQAPQPKRKAR